MSTEPGPSRPRARGAHPAHPRPTLRKLRPPPPAPPTDVARTTPTLPTKILQGAGVRRGDAQRAGFPRQTIFVTRRTGLGGLIGRARGLVLEEGYTHITLYALGAAIPHALLLLHALLDVLPYPTGPRGMWYELRTGSVECVDEVEGKMGGSGGEAKGSAGQQGGDDDDDMDDDDFPGLGAVEEDAPTRRVRTKSSLTIDLHVTPRPGEGKPNPAPTETHTRKRKGKARPNAKRRKMIAAARREPPAAAGGADVSMGGNEEDMMNG